MQSSSLVIVLLIFLIIAIIAILGFIVYLIQKKSHGKYPSRIGRYRILKELPSGGMSRIFLGARPDGKHVIVKIPVESRPSEESLAKFLEEGAVLSQLNHPHIVGLEDYGKTTINGLQTGYIVLEYVPGHSLDRVIKGGKKFTEQESSLIIASVADALELAHKAGIFHRDISTNNILINSEGGAIKSIKLIDFGIAKWQSGSEHTYRDMMKEHYASPEQIGREQLDGRTDIYSLGIVYYELITGKKPFPGWDRKTAPQPPAQMGLPVQPNTDNLIMSMLLSDRSERVQVMSAVLSSTGQQPLGGQIYAPFSKTGPRPGVTVKASGKLANALAGNRKLVLGMATAAVILAVLTTIAWVDYSQRASAIADVQKPIPARPAVVERIPITRPEPVPAAAPAPKHVNGFCPSCGKHLEGDGFKFCPYCQNGLPQEFW